MLLRPGIFRDFALLSRDQDILNKVPSRHVCTGCGIVVVGATTATTDDDDDDVPVLIVTADECLPGAGQGLRPVQVLGHGS